VTRLFLIDGTALAYRAHFAFAGRGGLTTRDGQPTAAVFGFTMTLRALLEREKPDLVAVAFDGPREELHRTRVYAPYKSTRDKMPDELLGQLEWIAAVVRAYGIPIVDSPGHEADDVIGTLAVAARAAGIDVWIVTGDKDFMQLVDDERIRLWNLRSPTSAPELIGPTEVHARFGVRPDQIVDLLALMGDSSDNVPGVPRIGEKTAAQLLQQFGTLDALLARAGEIEKKACREAIQQHADQARLSRTLVTIETDVPLAQPLASLQPPAPDLAELQRLFTALEFHSLLQSLPRPAQPAGPRDYRIVRDEAQLEALRLALREAGAFAFDTETTSLEPFAARLVGLSFATEPGRAWYVPLNLEPPILPDGAGAVLERLRPLLEDPALPKTAQNAKFDMAALRAAGVTVRGLEFDTMLASYCLWAGVQQHGLDALALRYFGYTKIPTKQLLGTGKKQKTFDQVDIELAGEYGAEDADFTWRLRGRLQPELEQAALWPLFAELEMPLVEVLLDMEAEGIALDRAHLERLAAEWQERIATIERRIHERAGAEFNLNSPAQIGEVLFDKLEVHKAAGITRPRRTPTGQWKTDAGILELLAQHHEVPRLLLDWRHLTKLKSTYVDALLAQVRASGRIHTCFNQAVAATGRLSSDNPNLQNIPIRTTEGREVRRAFVARAPGWVLMSADYSQIELRILAHMAQESALVDAFRKNEDIHLRTAAVVHGLLPGMVTPELRAHAKVVNYGLVYGMGPSRLAAETGMTPPQAKRFIEDYFRALPRVKAWIDATIAEARRRKEVRTLFGRRRLLPEIDSDEPVQRVAGENMALNTPIQGTAADIIKRAMLRLHAALRERGLRARLLLQVHDELVLDVPQEEIGPVTTLVRDCMQHAADLAVPLEVAIGTGANWLDAH
jgi:DNA polymerase-1